MNDGFSINYYNTFSELLKKEGDFYKTFSNKYAILSQEIEKESGKRLFFIIEYTKIPKFIKNTPDNSRAFHELIYESNPRKLFLDIDFNFDKRSKKISKEDFLYNYLKSVQKVLDNNRIIGKPMVYDSSNESKFSFHIIISDSYVYTKEQSLLFAEEVKKCFEENPKKRKTSKTSESSAPKVIKIKQCHIDMGVYNKNRTLRLLFCRKLKDDVPRWKRPYSFCFQNNLYNEHCKDDDESFLKSMITYVKETDRQVKFLGNQRIIKPKQDFKSESQSLYYSLTDLDQEEFIVAYEQFAKENKMDVMKISDRIEDNQKYPGSVIINLRRKYPSYCICCNKNHDSENAYLLLNLNSKRLLYSCYRSPRDRVNILEGSKIDYKQRTDEVDDDEKSSKLDDNILESFKDKLEKFK